MSMLTLAVVSTVSALSVFGKDRLMFWRERSGGAHMLHWHGLLCFGVGITDATGGALLLI